MDAAEPSTLRKICNQIFWFLLFAPVCVPILIFLWDMTRYLMRRISAQEEEQTPPDGDLPSPGHR
jgi:hypothetical protein